MSENELLILIPSKKSYSYLVELSTTTVYFEPFFAIVGSTSSKSSNLGILGTNCGTKSLLQNN